LVLLLVLLLVLVLHLVLLLVLVLVVRNLRVPPARSFMYSHTTHTC
jgi:hypothetical protein